MDYIKKGGIDGIDNAVSKITIDRNQIDNNNDNNNKKAENES